MFARASTSKIRLNKRTKVKDNERTISVNVFSQLCLPLQL